MYLSAFFGSQLEARCCCLSSNTPEEPPLKLDWLASWCSTPQPPPSTTLPRLLLDRDAMESKLDSSLQELDPASMECAGVCCRTPPPSPWLGWVRGSLCEDTTATGAGNSSTFMRDDDDDDDGGGGGGASMAVLV